MKKTLTLLLFAFSCYLLSAQLSITLGINPGNCSESIVGYAHTTVNGGITPYTYLWTNGVPYTQGAARVYTQGLVSVMVIDNAGDTAYASMQTPPLEIKGNVMLVKKASCPGDLDGKIEFVAYAPTNIPALKYVWSNGDRTSFADSLQSGMHWVVVYDSTNNCGILDTVYYDLKSQIRVNVVHDYDCINGTFSLTAVPKDTLANYTYRWYSYGSYPNTYIDSTPTISNLTGSENYRLVVSHPGCLTRTMGFLSPNPFFIWYDHISYSVCSFPGQGRICPATSVQSGYTYAWSNGDSTRCINNLTGGQYSVIITDTSGCLAYDTFTVKEVPSGGVGLDTANSVANIQCGDSTGRLEFFVGSYVKPNFDTIATPLIIACSDGDTIIWNDGDTINPVFDSLPVGTYTITVTDANGCSASQSESINGQAANFAIYQSYSCSTNITTLSTNISQPTGFQFLWNTGDTTAQIIISNTGNYYVNVTDSNGCQRLKWFTASSLSGMSVSTYATLPNCTTSNGTIITNVSLGSPPYSYLWNTGDTTSNISGLSAGTYWVMVTDTSGCQVFDTVVLNSTGANIWAYPDSLLSKDATCGNNDGEIHLLVNGGTINWNNGDTGAVITNLAGNVTYVATITNATGCFQTFSYYVDESLAVSLAVSSSCSNVQTLTANVTGGSAPYTYQWNTGDTTQQINVVVTSFMWYSVTVTDSSGCLGVQTIFVSSLSTAFTVLDTVVFQPSCTDSTGIITLITYPTNGVYTYLWNTGDTINWLNNLPAGTYWYTVSDTNGCSFTDTIVLNAWSNNIWAYTDSLQSNDATCGNNDGQLHLVIGGGNAPYTINWSNGDTGVVATNLAGNATYLATVTDNSGCTQTFSFFVNESLAVSIGISNNCTNVQTLTANVIGGSTPYSFQWINGDTSQQITVMDSVSSWYNVTVIDSSGCTGSQWIYVPPIRSIWHWDIIVSPICAASNGSIDINPYGGSGGIYTYLWNTGATTKKIDSIPAGTYWVTVSDTGGCSVTDTFNLLANNNNFWAWPDSSQGSPASCGMNNGSAAVSLWGGTPPYSYLWSNGDTVAMPTYLWGDSTYMVTVTDSNGCMATTQVWVQQVLTVSTQIIPDCGGGNGSITVTPTSGSSPFTYSWNTGDTTNAIHNITSGWYSLVITDSSGCSVWESIFVPANNLSVSLSSNYPSTCTSSDGNITAFITGGVPPYSILWNNSATTPTISSLTAGSYNVTVTDSNGCVAKAYVYLVDTLNCYAKITGRVYHDDNANCIFDGFDYPVPNVMIQLSNGQYVFTNNVGVYCFYSNPGTYVVNAITPAGFNPVCPVAPPNYSVAAPSAGTTYGNYDFYFEPDTLLDLEITSMYSAPFVPGLNRNVYLCYKNSGVTLRNGFVHIIHPPGVSFVGSNPVNAGYNPLTRTILWNFSGLTPNQIKCITINLAADSTLVVGNRIKFSGLIGPIAGDSIPINNYDTICPMVLNSYDPNDKQVEPAGLGTAGYISAGDYYMDYKIRFQNTGTYFARDIVIVDTLSNNLDASTLQKTGESFGCDISVSSGNIVEFRFNNIWLPDSNSNEPESHGFVSFRIKQQPNLTPGTQITNAADIYFDFNAPIRTNKVLNTIDSSVVSIEVNDIVEIDAKIYPNPFVSNTTLELSLDERANVAVSVYNLIGQLVERKELGVLEVGEQKIDLNKMEAAGTYLVVYEVNEAVGYKKVIRIE